MKTVSRSNDRLSYIERYDLQDIFVQPSTSYGLIICYTLAMYKNLTLVSLELKAKHEENGVPEAWFDKYSYASFVNEFHDLKKFLDCYDRDDFGSWTANVIYRHAEVLIIGDKKSTEVRVSYSKDRILNIFSLLSEIEQSTFKFNNYDSNILNILKNRYNMSEKRAALTIHDFIEYEDIYKEFTTVITSGRYAEPSSAVNIEGYTAELLVFKYPLSLVGAYDYLIYLRESPEKALKELKKSLPRE